MSKSLDPSAYPLRGQVGGGWALEIESFQAQRIGIEAGNVLFFFEIHMWGFERGMANSFWNHVIQMMNFQDIYSHLWKVKIFSGNIYSL